MSVIFDSIWNYEGMLVSWLQTNMGGQKLVVVFSKYSNRLLHYPTVIDCCTIQGVYTERAMKCCALLLPEGTPGKGYQKEMLRSPIYGENCMSHQTVYN